MVAGSTLGVVDAPAASLGGSRGRQARLWLRPDVVRLAGRENVEVSKLSVESLQVLPVGALEPGGRAFGWRSFRLVDGTWVATLPAPLFPGIYPLWLRTRAGGPVLRSATWLMRVFAPGTLSRPSFRDPRAVVGWWVRAVARGTLVTFKPWPLPAWDPRDPRLHRLFVVAYEPPGQHDPGDRLGMFVTAFRNGYAGRWRFLEARLLPAAARRAEARATPARARRPARA